MEEKKYYRHQSYKRFDTYVDDWILISLAASNLNIKEYDLTEDDVNEYIDSMKKSQEQFSRFKKDRLFLWRIAYICFCSSCFVMVIFILPKLVITLILWLLFTTLFLLLHPLYVLYEGMEIIFDKKYMDRYFKINPHIERMVDDYKWNQHQKAIITL